MSKQTDKTIEQRARELHSLIDRYWDLAYNEGREGRSSDTEDGKAQQLRLQIDNAIHALQQQGGSEGVRDGQESAWIRAWRNRFISERMNAYPNDSYETCRAKAEDDANEFEAAFERELSSRAAAQQPEKE